MSKDISGNQNNTDFFGDFVAVASNKILDEKKPDRYQSFFLVLGLIFNDLKDLLHMRHLFKETYRKPDITEVNVHMGEYSGFISHNDRLLIATISEMFLFLKEYSDVTSSIKFRFLLKNLTEKETRKWNELNNYKVDKNSLFGRIAQLRSNAVFHYDHHNELRKGFIDCFFIKKDDFPQYNKAYYYSVNNMRTTRFFFSDAAADGYMKILLTQEEINGLGDTMGDINNVVRALMLTHLNSVKAKK